MCIWFLSGANNMFKCKSAPIYLGRLTYQASKLCIVTPIKQNINTTSASLLQTDTIVREWIADLHG